MKPTTITLPLVALLAVSAVAQTNVPAPATQPKVTADATIQNEIVVAPEISNEPDSAKFTEYRDFQNGVFLERLRIGSGSGSRVLQLRGSRGGRDDQRFDFRFADLGKWHFDALWDQTPHRISRNAQSPYTYKGDGFFSLPGNVGILTTTADTKNYLPADAMVNDQRIADFLAQNLHSLPEMGTQRKEGAISASYQPFPSTELGIVFSQIEKDGDKITYGTLGDRPPRTLNVEMPEPIEYTQRDLRFQAGYATPRYQLQFEIAAPEFENDVDTMRWQSMYFGPDSDGNSTYNNDVILAGNAIARRTISTIGQRALPPDNRFPNATATFGWNTALSGRLTATASVGRMKQDADFLPYSASSLTTDWNSVSKLPRLSADAKIERRLFNVTYAFAPVKSLNVRAFARSYGMTNDTPVSRWWYPTQDTAGTTGSVPYKSKRLNTPFATDRANYGVEGTYRILHSTLGLGYERESYDRDFREANTTEDSIRARFATQFFGWLAIRGRYTYGNRSGDGYDWRVASGSYWYEQSEASDKDNPRFSFQDHPDLRRFDVSDRRRNQFDFTATVTPVEPLSFSVTFSTRRDNFDSDVTPIQPLAGTTFPGATSSTLGQQFGLLRDNTDRYGFDITYARSARWSANVFASRDKIALHHRGMEFNDDEKISKQEDLIGNPGQSWVDPGNIWNMKTNDATNAFGAGAELSIIPERLVARGDFTYSRGKIDLDYTGWGTTAALDQAYYAFRSPEPVVNRETIANLGVEYTIRPHFTVGAHYLFDSFDTTDWMQEPIGGWVEQAGSQYFLRDSTKDNRWGNRLPRLGSYLAPAFDGNLGYITVGYRW